MTGTINDVMNRLSKDLDLDEMNGGKKEKENIEKKNCDKTIGYSS